MHERGLRTVSSGCTRLIRSALCLTAGLAFLLLPARAASPLVVAQDHSAHGPHNQAHAGTASDAATYRTVPISTSDAAFSVRQIRVRRGETVRFAIRNESELFTHEFTIGSKDVLRQHQRIMLRLVETGALQTPGGANLHAHGNSVLLAPGEEKEIVWTFPGNAPIAFGCTIPGHYEAGIRGNFVYRPLLLRREYRT